MAHVRQTIRERVVTDVTGLTTTGSRVFDSRIYPLTSAELPALLVYAPNEEIEYADLKPNRTQLRNLNIVIEAHAKATSSLEDTFDTIAKEVEEAISGDLTMNGTAKDVRLEDIDTDFNSDGQSKAGVMTIQYVISYMVKENDVETAT